MGKKKINMNKGRTYSIIAQISMCSLEWMEVIEKVSWRKIFFWRKEISDIFADYVEENIYLFYKDNNNGW